MPALAAVLLFPISAGVPAGQAMQQLSRAPVASASSVEPDALLVKTLLAIKANQLDVALAEVEKVLQAYPNFRLANLIKGDLLLARAQPLTAVGGVAGARSEEHTS